MSVSAAQIVFSRSDALLPDIPEYLPLNRAMAIATMGVTSTMPTQEDIHEMRARMTERNSKMGVSVPGAWDADWRRAMIHSLPAGMCQSAYKLGSLTGTWAGSSLVSHFLLSTCLDLIV
jgi:hypothetical protein